MNWLDIVILILIVIPTLIGLKNGIVKALFTVAGVIVGVILAGRFSNSLGEAMGFISDPGWAKVVAYAIILVVVMVVASIGAKFVKNVLSAILLNWVNRLGGAILGLFLGIFFCGGVLSMWVTFLSPGETVSNSFLAKFLLDTFPVVLGLLPAEFDAVKDFFQ
ncbi:MAG: CvpA family protein [Dehalococcoidales bacterium]|nr:CvpA family protein [Dehalococcoidales bacterium]